MTITELKTILEAEDFNVFLGEADDGTACPYIVLTNISHPNFGADNKVYKKTTSLLLRLVESEYHDWDLIEKLENTLDSIPIFYDSTDVRLESENVCETHYEINFYGGTRNA